MTPINPNRPGQIGGGKMKKAILMLSLMTIWASETMAQPSSSVPERKKFENPFIEGLKQGLDCVGIEQQGYDCKCVEAVREMVKSGEISKARGDFMIGRECKKLPPTPKADSGQDIMTFECMNRHIWQSRWLGNCPFCGGIGFPK